MKRLLIIAALFLMLGGTAQAICTKTLVTTTSTAVLAANDLGGGRRWLAISGGSSCPVYCDVGATAVAFQGIPVFPGGLVNVPAVQQPSNTFPIAPNGAVNCIVPLTMGCTSQTISACDN